MFSNNLIPTSRMSLPTILNTISKTLNVVNQAIPIYKQAKPMVSNAKNLIKLANVFTTDNSKPVETVKQNIQQKKIVKQINNPTFFL